MHVYFKQRRTSCFCFCFLDGPAECILYHSPVSIKFGIIRPSGFRLIDWIGFNPSPECLIYVETSIDKDEVAAISTFLMRSW